MPGDPVFRDPRFNALRNAIYHTERKSFLDRLNKTMSFFVVVFTAGVVANVATHIHLPKEFIELAALLFASLQLVFDFGAKARTHEYLQKRYYEMVSEMEQEQESAGDPEFEKRWSARLLAIAADEPLTMRALDAVAYNNVIDGLYGATHKQYRLHVAPIEYKLRNIFAYQSTNFQEPVSKRSRIYKLLHWRRSSRPASPPKKGRERSSGSG
jgi:hypothetical protein